MNATVKSTVIALAFVATLSRLAPVQAQETLSAVLSKSPVTLQSLSVVSRIRPVSLRIRPVQMQRRAVVYLSSRQQVQIAKQIVAY